MPPVCWSLNLEGLHWEGDSYWTTVRLLGLPVFFCLNIFLSFLLLFPDQNSPPAVCTLLVSGGDVLRFDLAWCWLFGTGQETASGSPQRCPLWHGLRNLISLECCVDVWEKCCKRKLVPEANGLLIIEQPSLRLESGQVLVTKEIPLFRTCGDRTLLQKPWSFSFSEDSCHWLVHSLTLPHSPTHLLFISSKHTHSVSGTPRR